jgi:ATP:corrinoid adenosyltransferase
MRGLRKMEMDGLIHIYMGSGKGKTTAAVGLCTRVAGRDKKAVCRVKNRLKVDF